eukprot:g30285.t1
MGQRASVVYPDAGDRCSLQVGDQCPVCKQTCLSGIGALETIYCTKCAFKAVKGVVAQYDRKVEDKYGSDSGYPAVIISWPRDY